MPKGLTECPICHGSGRVTESLDYEFVTRDPETSRCLICDGSGHVHPGKKLANGVRVASLNVSRKHQKHRKQVDIGIDTSVPKALQTRLNKVLASGKDYLIVTETEPYYLDVYRMIRQSEKRQGTWTSLDEERYVTALEEGYDSLMLDSRLAATTKTKNKEVANG